MSDSIASKKRTMHILHLDLAEQEQNLLNYIKSQFAQFCTLYIDVCSRKRFERSMSSILLSSFRFLDFSIISRLSHLIGTVFESSTVKSHRYWVNEIAMWDERSEISVRHQWRCRMNHCTSRQCVALSLSSSSQRSDEKYLLQSVSFSQFQISVVLSMHHLMRRHFISSTHVSKTSMLSSYKSILFFVETYHLIEDRFVRFCSLRIDAWSDLRNYLIEEACTKASEFRSHFVERVCWQQWQSLTCFNKSRIYSIERACTKASEYASLRKFQNSSLKKLKSASLRKLARKLRTDQSICSKQKTQTNAVKKCWKVQSSQKDDQEFSW